MQSVVLDSCGALVPNAMQVVTAFLEILERTSIELGKSMYRLLKAGIQGRQC